jgi:hypothetical protein
MMMQSEQPNNPMAYTSVMTEVPLLDHDEGAGFMGGEGCGTRARNSEPLSWCVTVCTNLKFLSALKSSLWESRRDKLEALKQQATAKLDSIKESMQSSESTAQSRGDVTAQDLQQAVDDTIGRLTDPLYTEIDFEQSLAFVDDIKSWSVAVPAVLPIVVSRIEKRMHTGHSHITLLTLKLADFLVKNASTLQFHQQVAATLMNTIAGIARGSAQQQQHSMSEQFWQRISDAIPTELRDQNARMHYQTPAEKTASTRATISKAKELIKAWGEGSNLFADTLESLVQEGVDFSNVNVLGPVALETIDVQAQFASTDEVEVEERAANANFSEIITGAFDTAKLYAEVRTAGDASLLEMVESQCLAQQQELSSIIEVCISTNDDATMVSAIGANEALQQAMEEKAKQTQEQEPVASANVDAPLLDLDFLTAPSAVPRGASECRL